MELVEFRLIGRGPASTVYAATRRSGGDQVAVKVMDAPGGTDAAWRRFGEIRAVVDGVAGRVPLVGGVVVERGVGATPVLVLPLFDGGSLESLVRERGPLSPEEVVGVGESVAGALAALHQAGVVHGSVSPANLLLSAGGAVLLGDAGVSLVAPRPAGAHAAPELGAGDATSAADVYALASVMSALIDGHPLSAPVEMQQLLTAASDTDPRSRPSAAEFQAGLGNCDMAPLFDARRRMAPMALGPIVIDPRPAAAVTPALDEPLQRHDEGERRQRRIAAWIGAAAAAIALVAFLGGRGDGNADDSVDAAATTVATAPPLATALAATTDAGATSTTVARPVVATTQTTATTVASPASSLTTSTVPPSTTVRRATTTAGAPATTGPASTAPAAGADPSTTVRLAGPPSLPPTTTNPTPPTVTVPGSVDQPVPVTTLPPVTAAPTTAAPPTTPVVVRPTVGSLSVSTSSGAVRVVASSADRCASSRWVLSGPVSHEQSSSAPAGCFSGAHAYDSSWYRLTLSPGSYSISLTVTNASGSATTSTGFTIA